MALILAHITLDCEHPSRLAAFWSAVLDRPVDDGAGDFFASINDHVAGTPSWFFIKVPEPKTVKNRLHVDLTAVDREAEANRLVELGASRVADHDAWGAVWTVMADPEGNEFCLGQQQ